MRYLILIMMLFSFSFAFEAKAGSSDVKAGIAAHKALYSIDLVSSKSGSGLSDISGKMYYEIGKNCDSWTSKHRFDVNYQYTEEPSVRVTSDFSNLETFDGSSFDFNVTRKSNEQLYEEVRGRAEINGADGSKILYTLPSPQEITLTADTLFPMMHTIKTIEHILKGDHFYNATVFDGTDDKGAVEINAFIGKAATLGEAAIPEQIDQTMLQSPAHHLQMAFYPVESGEENPDYEMDLVLHNNGVVRDITMHYPDFSLHQELIALEKTPDGDTASACTQNVQ